MDTYNVLLLGNGGREHAIAWKLIQSEKLGAFYIAPGNPGTAQYGKNVSLSLSDFNAILSFIREKSIELVIVGPEAPLVDGIADFLKKHDVLVFGPSQKAAMLEGSKEFAKEFMTKYNIPTADYSVFSSYDFDDALKFIQLKDTYPIVLKADGLAAGKGVFICNSEEEVKECLLSIKKDKTLSEAASRLVIEEYLDGEEASVFVISDGHTSHVLHNAQDHKRVGDDDTGLNTGGMGSYSPAPLVTEQILDQVKSEIINPTITGMSLEESEYVGILYVGLMITKDGPKVIEYNCRFGDPECQVILPSLQNDLLELLVATVEQRLDEKTIYLDNKYRCCVVLASDGYPLEYEKGKEIKGIDHVDDDAIVFHAGTADKNGTIVSNGGRVLGVVGNGNTLKDAINHAYKNVELISFENKYFRKDIGRKGLNRLR